MSESIKIVFPNRHENQMINDDALHELQDVQNYFDKENIDFDSGEISFVFLKGFYKHIIRKMTVIGVFVNNTDKNIVAFKCSLKLKFKNVPAQIATVHLYLPNEFVGELRPNEGLLLHVDIPVQHLKDDQTCEQSEITGELLDVELKYTNQKVS